MIKNVGKRGDTLVEVMLAVGIFSMVAVAVVSVMSGGTNSSQTALETTLTREEIDNQAEALRFIHRAYVADVKNGQNSKFGTLWKNITDNAANSSAGSGVHTVDESITKYNPSSCDELYDGGTIASQNGFIINAQQLPAYMRDEATLDSVIVRRDDQTDPSVKTLERAATYPHLIYGGSADTDTNLIDRESTATGSSNLYAAEGIYVVAVKDPGGVGGVIGNMSNNPSYYDFYIRTCWYGTGDQSPSTISTVMRLYNPDINAVN